MYSMEEMTSSIIDDVLSRNTHASFMLNLTVLCSLDSCKSFLKQPFEYDRTYIWRNSLLHFSRWLVGIFDDKDLLILEDNHIPFDNVAVISFFSSGLKALENSHMLKKKQNPCSREADNCNWFPIYTLLWHQDRRGLTVVKSNGSTLTDNEIFPNAKFGFNKRKFLVSTIPSYPFVVLNNRTKTYTGITMDLLRHLSDGLNFTYDLIGPPDGNWGAEIGNGTWNGMVGQLQRKEVDMVATAFTVLSQREVVMDFTQPYYYESTSILIKKPDPDDKQWTKLLDPFSSTVFLCVGISVPSCALLLFLFEKYNPFYRKVKDKREIQELHQFSESVWYMYGSLLTHGGIHIAASTAGRTFLSCWWIFCIVIVATYSGNFVAVLSVTKETLPFEGIEGLVGQDMYKWGTIGGSGYETIFKNSQLPEREEFWDGVLKFSRSDPSVLRGDYDAHILKVLQGGYAFLWDDIPNEISVTNSCELAKISTDMFSTYAIGLPNNSPFEKIFTDGIILTLESGLIDLWMAKVWPQHRSCRESSLTSTKPIAIFDIQIAFYIIGGGICLAVLSLLAEYFKIKCQKCPQKQQRTRDEDDIQEKVNYQQTNSRNK
ncbi:glutamate receptor U1-like [Mytilus galloprovincialis]|uniref:glutamate receptor U1-like n=1 Tax=Mytilus galloprovincialis TaxID=29158 RepID=UPI003F7C78B8